MSEIRACKICGRLFNYIYGDEVCEACKEKQEDIFHKVRDYLWDNPGANATEVCEIFDISHRQLMRWLRDERLEISENSPIRLVCERCGAPITIGRYCKDCLAKQKQIVKDLDNAVHKKDISVVYVDKKNESRGAKMRFLGGDKKDG